MPQASTYTLATRASGDFLLGTNAAGAVKRFAESGRERLYAARTYYVRSDGSDSNTGLVNSSGGAFLTIQKAYDVITSTLDLGGQAVTIQVVAGTYTGGLLISQPWTGGGTISVTGDTTTPGNVIISTTSASGFDIEAPLPGALNIGGFKLTQATSGHGIFLNSAGTVNVTGKMEYGSSAGYHLIAGVTGAFLQPTADYTISGGAVGHYLGSTGGVVFDAPASQTITISGTPAFSGAFASADTLGSVTSFATFSGSATGKRYDATLNAVIQTFGGGANYFPGNSAGTTATGGQYA